MPKNLIQWCIVAFLSAIAIGFISTAIETTQSKFPKLDRASKDLKKPEKNKLSPEQSIIGKWRQTGTLERGSSTDFDIVIEYFEDNTYNGYFGLKGFDRTLENGEYVVLSDGRVKKTYESCSKLNCKKKVYAVGVKFPDQNTMQETYSNSPDTSVYRRIDTELEKNREGAYVSPDERLNN